MPVTVRFNPNVNSLQSQVIENATLKNDGVMTKEQAAQLADGQPDGQMIVSMMNGPIGTQSAGSASGSFTVPMNWHALKPTMISTSIAPTAALLLPANLALIDGNTFLFVDPDANGIYAVAPGQLILVFVGYYNVSAIDPAVGGESQATVTFTRVM